MEMNAYFHLSIALYKVNSLHHGDVFYCNIIVVTLWAINYSTYKKMGR